MTHLLVRAGPALASVQVPVRVRAKRGPDPTSAAQPLLDAHREALGGGGCLFHWRASLRERPELAAHVHHVEHDPQPADAAISVLVEVGSFEVDAFAGRREPGRFEGSGMGGAALPVRESFERWLDQWDE
jgi:hypothetical protein